MALLENNDKIVRYRYTITEFFILYENEEKKYTLPNTRITNINILNRYFTNAFPIFNINLVLESSVYYKLIKNKDTVKFKIRMQKYEINDSDERVSFYTDFINDTFSLILDDDDNDLEERIREGIYENGDENELNAVNNNIELYLFKSSLIKSTKDTINCILRNSTVTNAIAYIASKINLKNVLISPVENKTMYDQLIIPPMTATQALRYIDTYYGLYEKGSVIYFDLNYTYIINFKGGCSAYKKNEKKNTYIIVPEYGGVMTKQVGSVKKYNNKTDNYIVASSETMKILNESTSNDIIIGNDAIMISYNDDTVSLSETDNNSVQNAIIENRGINKFLLSGYDAQLNSMKVNMTINMVDIDLEAIEINKKFIIEFGETKLNKKYKGTYILCSKDIYFKKYGDEFSPYVTCSFRRV